jgi:iron(III) transport system ATP-binding protein
MAEVQVRGLQKAFNGQQVLSRVDLDVPSGNLFAILGSSGSGKTTLLRLLCGFERADGGTIRIGNKIVTGHDVHVLPEKRDIGYVAQEGALFPHLSVAENIVFGLPRRERRLQDAAAQRKVDGWLEMVGLSSSFARRPPHELSGGEQQRIALARALAPEPSLVLLDEPFSALDAALRAETRQAVATALEAVGATALLVTHDQPEALAMGHQVAVLRQGKLVQIAEPEILYRRPIDPDLARFVGEAVLIPGLIDGDHVACCLGRLHLTARMPPNAKAMAGRVNVLVRPEQIRLTKITDLSTTDSRSRWQVRDVTFYGHDASVGLGLIDEHNPVRITARVPGHMTPHPGDRVSITVEGDVVAYLV